MPNIASDVAGTLHFALNRAKFFYIALASAAGVICFAQGIATRNALPNPKAAPSGRPFPASFTDVAKEAGVKMRFTSGNEQSKKYIVEANGSGVAFLDYDRDGRQDIFLVNGSRLEGFPRGEAPTNHLFHNEGNGRFRDVTSDSGMARAGWGNGVCIGDIDNDGFEELYVTYWGKNALFRNDGRGRFTDIAAGSGVEGDGREWSSGCTFLDYDRDGYLDLLVTSYQAFDPATTPPPGSGPNCEWKGMPVFCGPRGLPYGKVTLYRNRGDGTFEDVSVKAGVRRVAGFYPFTAVALDLNGDGWTDVYIACDSTPSIFFRNNKNGTFTDIATETGIAFNEHGFEQGGMGIAAGDFDNDGAIDLLKTNFAGDYPNLYRNLGGGIFEDNVMKAKLAVNPQFVGWGVGLVDLDNDGWKDIFQVNGHVYPELDKRKGAERYRNPRLVYRNLGGVFEDVSAMAGPGVRETRSSRGAAFGDFDNDGDLDVLIMNMGEPVSLLRNDLKSGNHWIKIELQGTRSNRSAIGAQVVVETAKLRQSDVVLSQSSYLSHNDSRLHFGLGGETSVARITVHWPNGGVEPFPGAPSERLVRLVEGSGQTTPAPLPR
ncbi:MAG: CRTAC1 family protein [Acidobacteriota bacterium]|nr:CRTAC1 family protein [Acidobacteriota bacterium]